MLRDSRDKQGRNNKQSRGDPGWVILVRPFWWGDPKQGHTLQAQTMQGRTMQGHKQCREILAGTRTKNRRTEEQKKRRSEDQKKTRIEE